MLSSAGGGLSASNVFAPIPAKLTLPSNWGRPLAAAHEGGNVVGGGVVGKGVGPTVCVTGTPASETNSLTVISCLR